MALTVAIDFDGCLHPYTHGWTGHTPADEPPGPGTVDFLMMCKSRGFDLVVFSCRADHDDGERGIRDWLARYGLTDFFSDVTNVKPVACAYVDDRAVRFDGDWMTVLADVQVLAERPTGKAWG